MTMIDYIKQLLIAKQALKQAKDREESIDDMLEHVYDVLMKDRN